MLKTVLLCAAAVLAAATPALAAADKPTIVLVHGAFAEGASWAKVAARLKADHFPVVVAANQLRSVEGDAASVAALLGTIKGPIVLVGHSYGGVVISNAAKAGGAVKALVYVAGFAPDTGESAAALSAKFPGSALAKAILPAPMSQTDVDLYIQGPKFHAVFAADVPAAEAAVMQISQRPVTQAALTGNSGSPAWRTLPSWFIYGDADQCIPAAAHDFMVRRAAPKRTVVISGGSHALMISHPTEVAKLIELAATSVGGIPGFGALIMSQRAPYDTLAADGMKALGGVYAYILRSDLEKPLVDLVYLRTSQINGCAYCIDMHSHDLLREGFAIEKLAVVSAWREAGAAFSEREKAALAWAEVVTRIADTHAPDADYEAAVTVFGEKELADLTIAIGLINTYNRVAISFRKTPPWTAAQEGRSR